MKAFIAGEYGLAAKRYPLVKFYFSLREQFAKFYGRETGLEDFGELESLATWELEAIKSLRYVDVRPKRGGEHLFFLMLRV